jgi:hypothetical protein
VTPGTVLITIGRLPKALDFARAFHARGWRVVVAEPFRRHLTGASRQVARSMQVTSPVRDSGPAVGEGPPAYTEWPDPDGSRNDRGMTGGPGAR